MIYPKIQYLIIIIIFIIPFLITGAELKLNSISVENSNDSFYNSRERHVIKTGKRIGAIHGGIIGLYAVNNITKSYNVQENWKLAFTAGSAILATSYIGNKLGEYTTKAIVSTEPDPLKGLGQGAIFGGIDGAILGASAYFSAISIGHLTNIFTEEKRKYGDILKDGVITGSYFGGSVGLVWGIYGVTISLYIGY